MVTNWSPNAPIDSPEQRRHLRISSRATEALALSALVNLRSWRPQNKDATDAVIYASDWRSPTIPHFGVQYSGDPSAVEGTAALRRPPVVRSLMTQTGIRAAYKQTLHVATELGEPA